MKLSRARPSHFEARPSSAEPFPSSAESFPAFCIVRACPEGAPLFATFGRQKFEKCNLIVGSVPPFGRGKGRSEGKWGVVRKNFDRTLQRNKNQSQRSRTKCRAAMLSARRRKSATFFAESCAQNGDRVTHGGQRSASSSAARAGNSQPVEHWQPHSNYSICSSIQLLDGKDTK